MRAILINPYERTITEIDHDGTLDGMYRSIQCDTLCRVTLTVVDDLWLNDVGMLTEGVPVFCIPGYPYALAGIGLILGHDDEGDSAAATVPLELVVKTVTWIDAETTGELEPTREETMQSGAARIVIGTGILRPRQKEKAEP